MKLTPAQKSPAFLAIEDTFARMKWAGRRVEGREVLEADFDAYHARIRLHAQAFAELNAVSVVATLGHKIPGSRTGLVSEMLMRTNHELTIGAFEQDYEAGTVLFSATNIFPPNEISPAIIASLVHSALAEADRITPFLTLVLRMTPEELGTLNLKMFLMREDLLPPVPEDGGQPSAFTP